MEKSKVYFTSDITSQKLVEMFKVLNKELPGKIAVKVHSGEKGNQNYLHPEFMEKRIFEIRKIINEVLEEEKNDRFETNTKRCLSK